MQRRGKQCPSASAVSHNPAATCKLCNGKILIAEVTSTFGKARLCVNRLCETPASRFCFVPTLYPADSSGPVCPFRAAARSAGTWPKIRVKISMPEKGGSAAAAPPSLPLCCCKRVGRALSQPSSMLEGSRDTNNVPELPLPCRCPGCGLFYILGLG